MSMPDEQLEQAWIEIDELKKEIEDLKLNCDELELAAKRWMDKYDKLKSKYEPEYGAVSEAKLREVPWTKLEAQERILNGEGTYACGVADTLIWAERRIRERGNG